MANAANLTGNLLYTATILIILCTPTTKAQFIGFAACPYITPGAGGELVGRWFEQMRYDSRFQSYLRCVTYTFGPQMGALHSLNINALYKIIGRQFELHGRLTPVPVGSKNTYTIDFNTYYDYPQNFFVLGIRSSAWAVLYSCTNYGFFNVQQAVILTRDRISTAADIDAALAVLASKNLPRWNLRVVDQTSC